MESRHVSWSRPRVLRDGVVWVRDERRVRDYNYKGEDDEWAPWESRRGGKEESVIPRCCTVSALSAYAYRCRGADHPLDDLDLCDLGN